MATISLALIVRDVEKTIDKCLSTFRDCSDEIVVVDTGSVDNTIPIVKRYTNKIYHFKWIDDFSVARNLCFEKCTKDFIQWCDGDDYILPEDVKKIRSLDYSGKEIIICQYVYCTDEFGQPSCIVPRERIIKRSLNLKWEQPIHEYLPIIGHQQYVTDIRTYHQKQHGTSERNLKILENIVQKNSKDSRNIYYLGREYLDFGRIDDGIKYLEDFIKRGDGFWEDIYTAHFRLAQAYMGRDEMKFKHHIYGSLEIEERRAEPFYMMAQYWESKQQWLRAIQWYELCVSIKRPEGLLASYQPEYYTWLPCLQLCVCYNCIGNLEKALEWNEKALSYRPQDNRMVNNKKILLAGIAERKKNSHKDGQGKKLNLGCGGKKEPGYINVDLFKGSAVDEVFDLDEIPYRDNTITAINSEHSLEHVGWIRADKALAEWYRVLKPGGQMMLKIPDFADCCRNYLQATDKAHKQWYKYTIYGIQKSQAGEPDEAQTHRAGWSMEEMCEKLESLGFIIDFAQRYNGWDTPSTAILAIKPISPIKVGWIAPINYEAAQTRIRVLMVNRWLRSKGYRSDLVNYPEIVSGNYDVCIVGKTFDEHHYANIKLLKQQYGKTVICDLCEQITGPEFPYVDQILSICDLIVCCSRKLEEAVQRINPNTIVIEDAFEF
jgi:glycosyltransferase involved in cell wall biosynthesis/predicted SAM-dependent methyltransferase